MLCDMEPTVLYEDDHILAINKPSGLVVHAGVGTGHTLADWLYGRYPALRSVGDSYTNREGITISRPGIVHRLDRDTSGIMLIAKHQEMFHALRTYFRRGKVTKEYHAFVYGTPKHSRGTVHLSIGKSRSDFRKQSVRSIRGKEREAHTEYVVARRCSAEDASFVKFFPMTGRTHQIRVHAQSLQTPVVGDGRYAPKRPHILGFSRLALHAYRISVHPYPYSEPLDIIAPHPDDFSRAMSLCGGE